MSKCNIYYSRITLWLYANFALSNILDQADGVLRIVVKNNTTGTTKKLGILVSGSGQKNTPKNYSNITKNMHLIDESTCVNGGKNIGKTLPISLKTALEERLAGLSRSQKVNSAKSATSNLLKREIIETTVNLSKSGLFVGSATSILETAKYLPSSDRLLAQEYHL